MELHVSAISGCCIIQTEMLRLSGPYQKRPFSVPGLGRIIIHGGGNPVRAACIFEGPSGVRALTCAHQRDWMWNRRSFLLHAKVGALLRSTGARPCASSRAGRSRRRGQPQTTRQGTARRLSESPDSARLYLGQPAVGSNPPMQWLIANRPGRNTSTWPAPMPKLLGEPCRL